VNRPIVRAAVLALISLLLGVAAAAAVFAYIPDPGSAPSIFDDFKWDSTANGFWHVNAIGSHADIKKSILTLSGDSIELDRRVQTDPNQTVVVARVRGIHFHKFGLGEGVYHAGTLGLEFDDDGIKCGRGSDAGWRVDIMKKWSAATAPAGQWFYLEISVTNPYPNVKDYNRAEQLVEAKKLKKLTPVTLTCSWYDDSGHLLGRTTPHNPPPNAHYVGIDEVFMRTWDSKNDYQIDWFYAGPPSGNPAQGFLR
jgi:hypothetical protein